MRRNKSLGRKTRKEARSVQMNRNITGKNWNMLAAFGSGYKKALEEHNEGKNRKKKGSKSGGKET